MIQQRNPSFALVPEWGERLPGMVDTGQLVQRKPGRPAYPRRVRISTCERCGGQRNENESRRVARRQRREPFICGDCRLSDPEYVTMVTPTPQEVACPA